MPQTIQTMSDGSVRVSSVWDGSEYLFVTDDQNQLNVVWGSLDNNGYVEPRNISFKFTKRFADYLINAFGPEGVLGGFSGNFYNLDAGPSSNEPWLGFCEEGSEDGRVSSVIVASLYNSNSYDGNGFQDDTNLCYCDIAGNKRFIGNGDPIQWDSIFDYYSYTNLDWKNGDWSQGVMTPVVPGLNGEYGVYFDQSWFLLDTTFTSKFINPGKAALVSQYKTALQCKMKDFFSDETFSGRSFFVSASPDTVLDSYVFFKMFISYYGYCGIPNDINFYPAPSGPSFFWQNKKNTIEFI